jgi:hypothetical protein
MTGRNAEITAIIQAVKHSGFENLSLSCNIMVILRAKRAG